MSDAGVEKRDYADASDDGVERFERPTGIKGLYYHPITQVVMLGIICFMGPGLYNALTGLGGAGQVDPTTGDNQSSALYATFAFMAFFGGSVNNKLGPRLTLLLGTFGYSLQVGSYLALNIHQNQQAKGFVIGAGAVLGICAGLLWTAQGSLMLSYPTESQKGVFIGIFWAIFNLGGVVGAAVSLGQNFHSTAGSVSNGTYIAFLVMTGIGVAIPMLMADPTKVIRSDGTKVTNPRHPSWKTELKGLYIALRDDPLIVLLFPMFFASNWFYTWQFNDYNAALFNIRGRALNNLVYWSSQIVGSVAIGLLLDSKRFSRRTRAYAGWIVLFAMVWLVHIWGYLYQRTYTRESLKGVTPIDIKDGRFPAHVIFFVFCGILDAMWQTTAYWMMGAMSNDPAKLAYLSGFYKSLQSAGAAGIWRADGVGLPYMNIFASTWALTVGGLVCALPMIYLRVKNTTDLEDETIARMDDEGHVRPVEKI